MKSYRYMVLAGLWSLAACQPSGSATGAPAITKDNPAVATVNGTPIARSVFEFYVKGVTGKPVSELTAEQRNFALDNLIRGQVTAQQAVKDGVPKDTDTAAMLELERLNVLQQAMSERYLKDKKPTDQDLHAEYDTQVALLPKTEYRARHILVATSAFAQQLIDRLNKGADFADLAKKESMDSSKSNGGELGWFTPDHMVKPFSEAVIALKKGDVTQAPVQTQYGWHVIQLEETRDTPLPPFEQVKDRLNNLVMQKKFKAYQDDLMKTAKVEKKL
jgi:peptidyl-prolyl cis-trans isomerase C